MKYLILVMLFLTGCHKFPSDHKIEADKAIVCAKRYCGKYNGILKLEVVEFNTLPDNFFVICNAGTSKFINFGIDRKLIIDNSGNVSDQCF